MASIEEAAVFSALEATLEFKPSLIREFLSRCSDLREDRIISDLPDFRMNFDRALTAAHQKIHSWGPQVSYIRRGERLYPTLLSKIENAPEFLFVRGNPEKLEQPGVCVVGSRKASEEGKIRAFKFSRLLVDNGFTVFSGLAQGIDTAAHLGALNSKGPTVAVIGTTIDRAYPRENSALQETISETGAVVSQFSALRSTQPLNFPMRNEVMSGLSLATVIVEASSTSGALTQAKQCLKQGRALFIMQNQIDRTDVTWPREFLKRGALAIGTFEDLMDGLHANEIGTKPGGQLGFL